MNSVEALLKEILAELKKINEYIDIQKAQLVINIRDSVRLSRSSVKKESDEHKHIRRKCQSPSVEDIANKIKEILKEEIGQAANGC